MRGSGNVGGVRFSGFRDVRERPLQVRLVAPARVSCSGGGGDQRVEPDAPASRTRSIAALSQSAPKGAVMVVPSPTAMIEKVPAVLEVYAYAPQAGDPPHGGGGIERTKGPALSLRPLTAEDRRTTSEGGRVPMWALYRLTAQARVRIWAWALATRARASSLA